MSMEEPTAAVDLEAEEAALAERARQAAEMGGDWDAMPTGKPTVFWPNFLRVLRLLKPYAVWFILVLMAGVISVVLAVAAPKVLGEAMNILFEGFVSGQMKDIPAGTSQADVVAMLQAAGQSDFANMVAAMKEFVPGAGINFVKLAQVLSWVLVIYIASAFLAWVQGFVINIIMVRTMYRLRQQVEEKINRLPLSYFDRTQRGELISRVTNDIENITTMLQQALSGAVTSVLTVVGVIIMMFSISWQLALVALISLPLMAIVFGIIGPRSQKAFGEQWKKVGRLNSRVEESFSGHSLVKVFGQEQRAQEAFEAENEELYRASFKAQFLSGLMMPIMMFIGSLSYVAIAVLGAVMVAGGQLRLGDVQAFIQYSQQFSQPLSELGGMATMVQSGTASAERVFQLLDADDESADDENAPELANPRGEIAFKGVDFSYDPEKPLIQDLSFDVKPGQTVAIVGPTGAGKTTLVNLIMRFYDITDGAIDIGGQDIELLARREVRRHTGMVLQDPWLFAGTIRDNIRFGNEEATDAQIQQAAEATYVDRFVRHLPEGYDTLLDDDASNISAGERQLITIARAFVADPSILILDEATSAVDTRTEVLVQQAMNALRSGRTSFVIAHRLSTIRDADLILVMEEGSIVEQGSHDELIKAEGAYYRLYQSQFEQAIDDGIESAEGS